MINKRAFLFATPLSILAACAPARTPASQTTPSAIDLASERPVLTSLIGAIGVPLWMRFEGTVRMIANNANPKPVRLNRAIVLDAPDAKPRFFDFWREETVDFAAAPSISVGDPQVFEGQNDAGEPGIWLERAVSYPTLIKPIEFSRLAPQSARVMMIDATRIWVVDGGVSNGQPDLSASAQAAFEAWKRPPV